MSRLSQYFLFYFCASTILVHGLSQRIARRSCPSCSQDCPEALTVQLPWDIREEADLHRLQSNERSLPINSLRNSFYSAPTQERIFNDAARNRNILSNQYPLSFEDRRSFFQQEPASEDLPLEHLDTFPKYLNKQNFLSPPDKPASGYRPRVSAFDSQSPRFPTRQFLDTTRNALKNLRNKFSEPSVQDRRPEVPILYEANKKSSAGALPVSYRVDRNREPSWSNLRGASNVLPQNFYPRDVSAFRHRREEEEKNAMKKATSPVSHDSLQSSITYNPTGFNRPQVKRDSHIFAPKDLNIRAPISEVLLRNWDIIRDSLESSKLAQQKLNLAKTDFSKMYSEKEDKPIVSKANNYNPFALPLDLHTSSPSNNEESFDWKLTARKNSQEFPEMERSEASEVNWPMYPTIGKNIRNFEEDEESEHFADEDEFYQQSFEDEDKNDTVAIEQDYNPYSHITNNWEIIDTQDLFDTPDLQRLEDTGKLGLYPRENNRELPRDDEDVILEDKAYANRITRPPVINVDDAYIVPRANKHALNNAKYPVKSPGVHKASENKDNVLHAEFFGTKGDEVYESKTITQNNMSVEDSSSFSKNNLNAEKYPVTDTQTMKSNAQDKIFTSLDPDLLDDVEKPPTELTESLPKSNEEFSTTRQE